MPPKRSAAFAPSAAMRIIVLHGKERFLLREHTRQIEGVLSAAHGDLERFDFDGASTDLATVLDEVRSYGLMQQHKLVVVDRVDQFLSGNDTVRRGLERYCEGPVDHATLLLRGETWRRSKLDKLIAAVGVVHKIEPVDERRAAAWCRGRCEKRYETTIEPDAASALVEQVGVELDRLDAEIGKLASFAGAGHPITTQIVADLVGLSRERQAWAIQSAIASGDAARAASTLRELLEISRQPEQLVSWAITDLLRKLHAASRLLEEGTPPTAVSKSLRLFGDSQRLILGAARRRSPARYAQLLRAAIETDWRTKRGIGDPVRSLEALSVSVADTIGSTSA
ncbi:MAG: DNA polymerase III subunit delta [Planctomycetota bacterium]|jgi:DNA polymerase-3 subunit delta